MLKKSLLFCAAVICLAVPSRAEHIIASNGKANYSIIYTSEEKEAATELAEHLKQITGVDFNMIPEKGSAKVKTPAFYVGNTEFSRKQKIDVRKMDREEWLIQSCGKNIILTGGLPRGTLYAVYELLEKKFNCRWFAYDTTVIPRQKKLILKPVNIQGKPSYDSRELYDDFPKAHSRGKTVLQQTIQFRKRIRSSMNYGDYAYWPTQTTQFYTSHTLYRYLDPNKYFKTNPELFSMNADGKRVRGTIGHHNWQGANLCVSNPKVADIVWKSLEKYIEKDRKKFPKEKWPLYYPISQMDSTTYICLCPECKKITKREGSESGLWIEFINKIAERLEKKYPDVKILTSAYVSTKKAPKFVKPHKNIRIKWTNLYTVNDCYRPITSKFNRGQFTEYNQWINRKIPVDIYEYWNMGGNYFNPLRVETCIDSIINNIKYFHARGSRSYFAEFSGDSDRQYSQNFAFLQNYVAYQLLKDVTADPELLIKEFICGFYGPAADPMMKFFTLVRNAIKNEPSLMHAYRRERPYCNEKFMKQVWAYLMEAQKLTVPGTLFRKHVEQEMLAPVYVILKNRMRIGNRQKLADFYKSERIRRMNEAKIPAWMKKNIKDRLDGDTFAFVDIKLEVPEEFRNREVIMLGWPYLSWANRSSRLAFEDDPDAAGGKALITSSRQSSRHDMKQTKIKGFTPLDFGLFDSKTKRQLHWTFDQKIPQDEKYHWYNIGQFELGPQTFLWGFYWSTRCNLSNFYRVADGVEKANLWTVWVSAKFTGPAYVQGSKKKNEIYWDQVMLVGKKKD